jgi:hypothetical protein
MRVKNLFSSLKVNSIFLILTVLISNSKVVLSVNDGDESTSKQEKIVQKHLKLNPLKEKEKLRNIKVFTPEKLHISYIKSDKNIKNSYSKDKYPVIEVQKTFNYYLETSLQDQEYRRIYPEMLLSDKDFEKLINKRLLEFQLNPQKCDEEWDEMLKREQMLGDMDLVLKDNPLLSTQSICKGVDFINNSELNLLEQKSQIQILHSINEES